jgi:hypothetical protein
MIDPDEFRALALALPEAIEEPHFDRPSFRVRKRIFATLRPAERLAVLKLSRTAQEALVASAPQTYALTPWAHQGWTSVDLRRADAAELRELVAEAWAEVAPKRLVAAFAGGR